MSIRESFVQRFSEEEAQAIEAAAEEHKNGIHDRKGSDPFRWAICICIGYQCMEKESYRTRHGITSSWVYINKWIKDEAHLESHDGDVDYLSFFVGIYNEYIPAKEEK